DCVVADLTVAIGFAKRGLIADGALNLVGRLEVVPLPDLTVHGKEAAQVATATSLRDLLPRRKFGAYKNEFGRVGIVAGSRGFTGAAVMCAMGALRGGAGLVELFVPEEIYDIVAAAAPPEAMVKPIRSHDALLDERAINVWAIGPGIGQMYSDHILKLIERLAAPCVLDADALNILSATPEILKRCSGPRLLTPHPGEMKRLFPRAAKLTRADVVKRFCAEYPATLLLKGSRTIVGERGRPLSLNTTGNSGMATGGMGDILTGICAALVAQKLPLYDAARLGAWLAGRAAELAIFRGNASQQTLLPTDVVAHLGFAFRDLQSGDAR
ncbi:MAG: NAD(P)H-hydrate dehydratase, partial [Chthoniobacterales bacterium]